jgi:hypothetical protein
VKNMRKSHRTKAALTTLLLCLLFFNVDVMAQGFGILSQQPQPESREEVLSSANGRYVFGQISDSDKDKFMLDTWTGRLWRIAESGELGLYLTTVPYRNKEGKTSALPEAVPVDEPSKSKEK